MATTEPRLADHFPLTIDECKEEAAKFFFCFSAQGQQRHSHDQDAGRRGLQQCLPEMKEYDNCINKYKQVFKAQHKM